MAKRPDSEFERVVLPHLGAAYSIARWLLRNPQDAEDAVQEGVLRAFKSFGGYAGGNAAAWLIAIVRNTALGMLERRRAESKVVVLAEAQGHAGGQKSALPREAVADPAPLADHALISEEERRAVHAAIAALPLQFREVVVLREFHDLSYREIAEVIGAPVGTVMSRLARARERLATELSGEARRPGNGTR